MKNGKINKIIIYKLDTLTRSIQNLEIIYKMIEQYNCSLESLSEELNTETSTGIFFTKITTILTQLEIERTSERTKFGLASAIIHYDETSPHLHIIGVPIKTKTKNGMTKQVGKSSIFTKESLVKPQNKMRTLCIESFNKEYLSNDKLKIN